MTVQARSLAATAETRTVAIAAVLFLLTFALYWFLGPRQTAYDFQVSQANNLIHGHLDMAPRYTHNLAVLERVLYDGRGFCLPQGDTRGVEQIPNPRFSPDCRTYMQHAFGPALLLLPAVLLWGLSVNQTLVSVLFAALTAPVIFAITRRFSDDRATQLSLTGLVLFGTNLWWAGSNGGVWTFAHTTAVFFLFCAIYATLILRSPMIAGALVGAAFMCRPTTLLAGFFPLVALSDQWLFPATAGQGPWRWVRSGPLLRLAAGVAPFVAATMLLNFLRFGDPFEPGYHYGEQVYQTSLQHVYSAGLFSIDYIARHAAVFWAQMPIFAPHGSYVWPSWAGLAMWATTPAFVSGLFVHLRTRRQLALRGALFVGLACAAILASAAWNGLVAAPSADSSVRIDLPMGVVLLPFWLLAGAAMGAAVLARDGLVLACWAAIVPIALANWLFAATGWAQFGYRYGLDFMPFVFLLLVIAVGRQVPWYTLALIGLSVLVNLWGVLWIYQFAPAHLFGWTWVSF